LFVLSLDQTFQSRDSFRLLLNQLKSLLPHHFSEVDLYKLFQSQSPIAEGSKFILRGLWLIFVRRFDCRLNFWL